MNVEKEKGLACRGQCDWIVRTETGAINCVYQLGHKGRHSFEQNDDAVNHPAHYGGDAPHETVKCLEAWGLEADALLWNAVKYISRAGKKGDKLKDLEKAAWYLNRRIESLKGEK
jgi:hypothetical protein